MKKIFLTLIFINLLLYYVVAQSTIYYPPIAFTWWYAHGSTNTEVAYCIKQTSDGGYIAVGSTDCSGTTQNYDVIPRSISGGQNDFWIVKLNSAGLIQYHGTTPLCVAIGGEGNDIAKSVVQLTDGSYVVVGETNSIHGNVHSQYSPYNNQSQVWVVHLDQYLNIINQEVFGGHSTAGYLAECHANSIELCNNGDLLISGSSKYHYDPANGGHVVTWPTGVHWPSQGAWNQDAWVFQIANNTAFSGPPYTYDSLNTQPFTVNFNYYLGGNDDEVAVSCHEIGSTSDYYLAGYSNATSSSGDINTSNIFQSHILSDTCNDFWVVKFTSGTYSNYSVIWEHLLGGNNDDKAFSLQTTNDGGCIVAGTSFSTNGDVTGHHGLAYNGDMWVYKLSSTGLTTGGTQWEHSYGGSENDGASSIKAFQNGYIIGGYSYSNDGDAASIYFPHQGNADSWFVQINNNNGNIIGQRQVGGSADDFCQSVATTSNGGYIGAGATSSQAVYNYHYTYNLPDMYFAYFGIYTYIARLKKSINLTSGFKSILVNLYDDNEDPPLLINQKYTDGDGVCEFDTLFSGVYHISPSINDEWGGVNATDAAIVNLYYNGEALIQSSLGFHTADVDNNLEVNSDDATKIIRRFVGLDNSFDRGDWIVEKPLGGDTLYVSEGLNDTIYIDTNQVYQDFYASCVGDVNGSYNPESNTSSKVSLNLPAQTGLSANKYYNLQFSLNGDPINIGAISLILNYPADLAEIKSVWFNNSNNSDIIYNVTGNELKIGWAEYTKEEPLLYDNNNLFIVRIKTTDNFQQGDEINFSVEANYLCEFANINGLPINSVTLNSTSIYYDGTKSSSGVSNVDKSFGNELKLQPNPAKDNLNIDYSISNNANVNISLYNVLGERVLNIIDNSFRLKGQYSINVDLAGINSGVYECKLSLNNITIVKSIVISK